MTSLLRQWFQLLTVPLNLHLYLHKSEPEIIFLLSTGTLRYQLSVFFHLLYQEVSFCLHSTHSTPASNPAQFQFTMYLCFTHHYHISFIESLSIRHAPTKTTMLPYCMLLLNSFVETRSTLLPPTLTVVHLSYPVLFHLLSSFMIQMSFGSSFSAQVHNLHPRQCLRKSHHYSCL